LKNKELLKNKLVRKTFWDFITKIFLWSTIFPLGCYFTLLILLRLDYSWLYNLSPFWYRRALGFYEFLFRDGMIFVFIFLIWLIGVLIFLYRLLKKVFTYVEALSKAANLLLDKNVEYIELPDELEEIERNINYLKRESARNEKVARENVQKKNDLVVYLAHDLKTPLTSLIGYLSLLEEVKDMPKAQREKYISITLEKSYKLEDLINELFDITRFNSEVMVLEPEEINLNLMLEQIVDDFYPVLKENEREIELSISDKIMLEADPDKLARVFNNLIKNAIYYSTDKTITIEINQYDSMIEAVITNKGKKISEEKLKRIFEKFYRADSSRTSKTGGSGLGLAIAKDIVELHGGTIKATSDKDYTKFYVELPLSKN